MVKKLKKNSGFAGIDISISIIIILIFIPTIFGIVYNIGQTNAEIKRKAEAVNIAVNVLEIAKSTGFDGITFENDNSSLNENMTYNKFVKLEKRR